MSRPPFTPIVQAMPRTIPFVGPETMGRQRGAPFRARLGANESHLGPSPKAIAAMQDAVVGNWMYSDPENWELRIAIAALHGVDPKSVVIGEGIDGLLGLMVKLFAGPGDTVITSDGAYPTFNLHVAMNGARLVKVAYRDNREDLKALVASAEANNARVIYLSNPDNPMGSWHTGQEITEMIARLPHATMLALDEAYCDTAPTSAIPPIDTGNDQVVRLRTLSKAYGMAGARIGYAIGSPEVISGFDQIRNHYGINRVGQIGAKVAIEDQAYLQRAIQDIAKARDDIARIARNNGLEPLPSATNFVTIDCGRDGLFAKAILDQLLMRDVFARKPLVAPLDRCIRISCGGPADLAVFAEELPKALAAIRL